MRTVREVHEPPQKRHRSDPWLFLRNFIKAPLQNASVVPSSARAARSMVDGIDFSKVNVVVELGPGDGKFTKVVLGRCRPGTKVVLIELEESYVRHLRAQYGSRVIVEHASAHTLERVLRTHGITHVDVLISGIPFLQGEDRLALLSAVRNLTDRGTVFRFFTYMPPVMKRVYEGVPVTKQSFVLSNFPPLWVYGVN